MTNLKKIINHAVSGGFELFEGRKWAVEENGDGSLCVCCHEEYFYQELSINDIIFSIPFLKAFFGEESVCEKCCPYGLKCIENCVYDIEVWQYHAQQLVLSEDRIKYLMGFVDG